MLDLLDNPQRRIPAVHVTGTNGKTTTAHIADALLSSTGRRVGRFTSPHLTSIRERIVVDGAPIAPGRFVEVYRRRGRAPLRPQAMLVGTRRRLDTLAALHGQSWEDDRPRRLGVEPLLPASTEPILRDFLAALPERFAAPRGFAAPVVLHDPDRLRAAFTAYRAEAQRGAVCVVHGDAHIGNAYVEPDGRVGFADWQTVALGPWVHDVNYFLVSALDVPDRQVHERDLLGHYLKTLATFGVSAPGLDEAWSDYRRATVYGFLSWLCNLDLWQPPDVNTATYARFGLAMIDHDTYAALGV